MYLNIYKLYFDEESKGLCLYCRVIISDNDNSDLNFDVLININADARRILSHPLCVSLPSISSRRAAAELIAEYFYINGYSLYAIMLLDNVKTWSTQPANWVQL